MTSYSCLHKSKQKLNCYIHPAMLNNLTKTIIYLCPLSRFKARLYKKLKTKQQEIAD